MTCICGLQLETVTQKFYERVALFVAFSITVLQLRQRFLRGFMVSSLKILRRVASLLHEKCFRCTIKLNLLNWCFTVRVASRSPSLLFVFPRFPCVLVILCKIVGLHKLTLLVGFYVEY
jgi:hypothetical protein